MYRIIKLSKKDENFVIKETVKVLKQGGLVIYPSDTVYGLLVDATNEKAVDKLIKFKNRPPGKAISVFVADMTMLQHHVDLNNKQQLLNTLLPGPFTIVLPSKHNVSKRLESEKGTLGVRIPSYALVNALLKEYSRPITATSANLGGRSPHYSVDSLLKQLPKEKQEIIDLIVDAGKLPHNKPSTVVDLSAQAMKILRKGDILFTDIQTYHTDSPSQTKKIGQYLIEKIIRDHSPKPIVFVIKGDLGSGKTVFTKGLAEYLQVEHIVSPTFVVYYEYNIDKDGYKRFVHADLYNIEDPSEFKDLRIEDYIKDNVIISIEWGEKLGELYDIFKKHAVTVFIEIAYMNQYERTITIKI